MSRNSITPSRAFFTMGASRVDDLGAALGLGGSSLTPMAQEAIGFGEPCTSTRHMRQLPAIDRRSW